MVVKVYMVLHAEIRGTLNWMRNVLFANQIAMIPNIDVRDRLDAERAGST